MKNHKTDSIYPVILTVPEKDRQLSGRQRVLNLSRLARCAIEVSAQKRLTPLGELLKNENGAPLPWDGNYWSISHKPEYVGGVVAPEKIGIDIEKIKSCSPSLFRKTALESEWNLIDTADSFHGFFRCWTAKEAVIKAAGTGIKDLLNCRITQVLGDHHLVIGFQNREWVVEHFFFNGHIASVVQTSQTVQWTLIGESA